ncbi:hypothetical protein BDZ91DRAFT_747299 [Kalaharituber pfeilii]|nr:hypothetical protein BDZ91DRAFT_747299 [Kalaharituber pfeilii]
MASLARCLLVSSCIVSLSSAFYIPGFSRHAYKDGEAIPLYTNKIFSDQSQVSFAYSELPFVCPNADDGWGSKFPQGRRLGLNFGELFRGDRISISDYQLEVNKNLTCQTLCTKQLDKNAVWQARELVLDSYIVEWIVDNLPGATALVWRESEDDVPKLYAPGFLLGETDDSEHIFLNNHLILLIRHRKSRDDPSRHLIVGFEVYTDKTFNPKDTCQPSIELAVPNTGETLTVKYTYSVYWREDESIEWDSRWERYYLGSGSAETKVHWLAIVNSIVIGLVLTGTVGVIMIRTLNRDIQKYNEAGSEESKRLRRLNPDGAAVELDDEDGMEDMTGWKLVHGDVFRPPAASKFFAPVVGSGAQLLAVCIGLGVFSAVGVLNPSYRGGFMSFGLFFFIFAGIFSGYFSTRIYFLLHHQASAPSSSTSPQGQPSWLRNALLTALLLPSFYLLILLPTNLLLWTQSSSTALPFTTILLLFILTLFISLPLVLAGSMIAKHRYSHSPTTKLPSRVNLIPRQIPPSQPWYLRSLPCILISGLFPFFISFIEIRFLFRALTSSASTIYIMYGFVLMTASLSLLAVAETSIIVTYFLLSAEDYRWWWRSFAAGAGSAVWVVVYAIWWYWKYLRLKGLVSALVYFAYVLGVAGGLGLVGGAVGWTASWWFVRKIYGATKLD